MPAYNFKEQFVESILNETKGGTIRSYRKIPQYEGKMMYLFTGLRTKDSIRLKSVPCVEVYDIVIYDCMIVLERKGELIQLVDDDELHAFAVNDGFESWEVMKRWWRTTHELPWCGFHARWTPLSSVFDTVVKQMIGQ